jgi:hypothetical protein
MFATIIWAGVAVVTIVAALQGWKFYILHTYEDETEGGE